MELVDSTPTVTRTPYGRACTNCSHLKCRCIFQPGELSCKRCQRLKKACQTSASNRKRSIKKPFVSRTARLEQKVDGLVSLLHSQSTLNHLHPGPSDTTLLPIQSAQFAIPTPQASLNASPTEVSDCISETMTPDALAEEQLAKFRQSFLPFFPFVYIPATMSASNLRIQKPFLSLVILSLTTKSASQQLRLFDNIRQVVSEKVLAEHERSLDILLGLICYLAWFQYQKNKSDLVMWTQVAVALAFELGLHKARSRDVGRVSAKANLTSFDTTAGLMRSLEERRAIIGMFIVSSMVWTNLRQIEALRWTPYMEDCACILREERETKLDLLLAFQAKSHVVVEQITHSPFEWGVGDEMTEPAAAYFVKALQQDMQQSVPVEMQSDRIVLLSLYGVEIIAKEPLLYKLYIRDQMDLRRLDGLNSLLTAIERWYEEFYKIPLVDWIGVSFEVFAQFWNCLTLLFKLTTLDEPGWDTEEVRKRVDLLHILEKFAQGFERLPEAVGSVDDTKKGEIGALFRAVPHIRATKAKFMADMTPVTLKSVDSSGAVEVSEDFEMCLADDPWLTEMFESL